MKTMSGDRPRRDAWEACKTRQAKSTHTSPFYDSYEWTECPSNERASSTGTELETPRAVRVHAGRERRNSPRNHNRCPQHSPGNVRRVPAAPSPTRDLPLAETPITSGATRRGRVRTDARTHSAGNVRSAERDESTAEVLPPDREPGNHRKPHDGHPRESAKTRLSLQASLASEKRRLFGAGRGAGFRSGLEESSSFSSVSSSEPSPSMPWCTWMSVPSRSMMTVVGSA